MEEYKFECIDLRKSVSAAISLPLIAFFVFYIMNLIGGTIFNVYLIILIPLSITFLFYWLIKNWIKVKCIARINDGNTEIEKLGKLKIIAFEELLSYDIQIKNSFYKVVLNLKNNDKIKISSQSYFYYKSDGFKEYCFNLEDAIDNYKSRYNVEIEKEKHFFEKKWTFPVIVIISIIWVTSLGVIISRNENYSLWIFIFPILTIWAGYFDYRNNKKD